MVKGDEAVIAVWYVLVAFQWLVGMIILISKREAESRIFGCIMIFTALPEMLILYFGVKLLER